MDVFLVGDDDLLKNYDVCNKVNYIMKKEFDSDSISIKKCLETKIKSCGDETTDFHDKKVPKVGSNYTCLAVIIIDFVLRKNKTYPQVFSK